MQIFSAGRTDGTDEPTEGSTRGPRGPKKYSWRTIMMTRIGASDTLVSKMKWKTCTVAQ